MGRDIMSIDTVTQVKQELVNQGVDLSGPCGAFKITKRVAWALRGENAGLFIKTSGNNCDGYATDIIAYPTGVIFDILGDGGGMNIPQWPSTGEQNDPARYHPAIDPGDAPTPPPVPPTPTPEPPVDLEPILLRLTAIEHVNLILIARIIALEMASTTQPETYDVNTSRTWGHSHVIHFTVPKK